MDGVKPRNWRQKNSGTHTLEIRTEALSPEVRRVIDQMIATINDHEQRIAQTETFRENLIIEATSKLRGAA